MLAKSDLRFYDPKIPGQPLQNGKLVIYNKKYY